MCEPEVGLKMKLSFPVIRRLANGALLVTPDQLANLIANAKDTGALMTEGEDKSIVHIATTEGTTFTLTSNPDYPGKQTGEQLA